MGKGLDYRDVSLPIEARVADLLGRMTLDEKVSQLVSYNENKGLIDADGNFTQEKFGKFFKDGIGVMRLGLIGDVSPARHAEIANAVQRYVIENSRLGIPTLFYGEALHGFMAKGSTVFPQAIALASSWDCELIERLFRVVGGQMRARGVTLAFGPIVDICRDPRWGRVEETFGEDPWLVGEMGMASVRGLQGTSETIDQDHVLSTLKHFPVHGQPEGGRNCAPCNISERQVRQSFLEPFEVCIKQAGAGAVMAVYNELDGIPGHINRKYLTGVLRREWGFEGLVVSDYGAVERLQQDHCVAADAAEAARRALNAGVDLENSHEVACYETLVEQVKQGLVDEKRVDEAAGRVLAAKFRLGLFDMPYVDVERVEKVTNTAEHRALALEAAEKSIVLLKNQDNLLPLNAGKIKDLAVIGPNAAQIHLGGYIYEPMSGVSVLDGLKEFAEGKFNVHYAEGCRINVEKASFWENWNPTLNSRQADETLIAGAVKVAKKCDAVVLAIGGNESTCREAWMEEHRGDRDSLDLIGRQGDLVRAILGVGKPVIVLLLGGRPLSINYIAENVPSILEGWYLGQETGRAVADVLFGEVNPAGKLPISFARSAGQIPVFYNHKPSRLRSYLFHDSGPLFPFGFGLSYTTFEYENLKVTPAEIGPAQTARVSVDVTNTGDRGGDEVVQMYIRDVVGSVTRPVKELKGFERIHLERGETKTVEFQITPEKLQFYNEDMERVVEPGEFEIMVGTNSVEYLTAKLQVT